MAKKWLSMILSIAMLLSCISGITLFTAAATEPYAWFDTAGGECTYDGVAVQEAYYDWEDPVAEEYGVRLSDGGKFVFGGELLAGVPAEQSVTLVLKYYIDGDITGTMFSYRIGDGNGEVGMAEDVAVTADDLVKNEVGTLYITLTEEDKAIATVEGDYFYVYVTGGADCADSVYIQSAKVVDTACDAMDDADAFHAYMLANELNTKLVGVRDATGFEEGYTGDVKCVTCDATLKAGEPIPATSDLPTPYAWFDTDGGVLTANRVLGPNGEAGHTDVMQIPDTDEYGIRLDADWSGFWIGGKFFENVPAEQSISMVVEYYITGDVSGSQQLFRYQSYAGMGWKDMFTDTEKLVGGKSGVFVHTYTAEERAAIENGDTNGDLRFAILGCLPGANRVYIQSVRLVNTEYVHAEADGGYAVWDANEQLVCDYYPDITATVSRDMSYVVQDPHWNFQFSGDVLATDNTVNKPLYFKITMKETFTGDTFNVQQFERYAGEGLVRWAYDVDEWRESVGKDIRNFPVTDGEVAFILPETSFTNANNGGSFRLDATLASQIERIEIYDLNTFCANEKASAEDIAEIHALFAAKNMNIEKVGRVEADEVNPGYTGDTVCLICDEVIVEGIEIPVIDPNRPFASVETAGGELVVSGTNLSIKDAGNTDVVAIGDTGEHGILLTGDWCGFNMNDISLLGNEGKVALLIEYYITGEPAVDAQMFRYQINDRTQVDFFMDQHSLARNASGLVYHVFTAEELAAIGDNTFILRVMGCAPGANVTYIQSVKVVSADLLNLETDAGYAYTEFAGKPLTDLYPDIMVVPSYNLSYADREQHPDHPGREWLYRYIIVSDDLLAVGNQSRPVYIKLYAAEGYENDTITINTIERTAGDFGAGATVQMVDGEGSVFVPSATFTNTMNAGSLRFWYEEVPKLARIEIYDAAAYCGREDADPELVELFHNGMKESLVNVERRNKKDPTEEEEGYTGDIYCATCGELFQMGTEIPKLEVSDLPDPYAYFDTANGTLNVGGTTLANQGVDPVVLPIGASGEYGIKLTGDWQGFRMEGIQLPTDKELAMVIEYYIDADLTSKTQLFRYQTYAAMPGDLLPDGTDNHWDDIFNDENNMICRDSGLLIFALSAEEVAAINGGESIRILGCGPGANISYIQSVRIIDSTYVLDADLGHDYMSFEAVPLCEYYPTIKGLQSSGMSVSKTEEGTNPDMNNEPILFAYFKVTDSLVGENNLYRPVVVRFTMKEDSTLETFQFSYQTARVDQDNPGAEWAHFNIQIENGVGEIVLEQACLDNGLNGLGSLRLPNHPSCPAFDNLKMIEVIGLTDTTELEQLIEGVEEAVIGKTKASADAYRAVVAQYVDLPEDLWVSDEDVAAAVAAIKAAADAMEDCTHEGDTKLVGASEVKNHVVPGYTGDVHCAECNELLEEGEVIPAHNTEIRDVKEPTCKEPGNAGDCWCLDCDELVTAGDPIMQLPHKWNDGEVTKPATPDEKGENTFTCTVCDSTRITYFDFEASLGDVDGDGAINSTDARLVLQFAVKKIAPTALNLDVADVDGNDKVDSTDARLILQYAVKKIQEFPAA